MKKRIKLSENCVNESLLYFYFSFVVHQLFAKLPQRQKVQNKPLNSLNIERIIEVWWRNCWSEEVEKRTYPTHYHTPLQHSSPTKLFYSLSLLHFQLPKICSKHILFPYQYIQFNSFTQKILRFFIYIWVFASRLVVSFSSHFCKSHCPGVTNHDI
jgi:hypothetical protein